MKIILILFFVDYIFCQNVCVNGTCAPPPPRAKNGYIIFRERKLLSSPPNTKFLPLWKKLDADERKAFIAEGNIQRQIYDDYQEKLDAMNNGPLPLDHSVELVPDDLISSYLDRINPVWKLSSSYISLRDDPKYVLKGELPEQTLERVINYRYQITRSCFAQVAMLAYKYALNEPFMLNLNEALTKVFGDKESLLRGGNTVDFLKRLFSAETTINTSSNLINDLHQYGPLLVTFFRMDVTFRDFDMYSHDTYEEMEGWGYHAMLLIGHRVENGKNWFLLQNSWRVKQFVEVSETYLSASQALVMKIVSPKKADNLSITPIQANNSEMDFPGLEDIPVEG